MEGETREGSDDAKSQALASLKRLRGIIEEKEKCLLTLSEELEKARPKNSCWWDMKPCLNYSQTGGFQEVGTLCDGCFRVDQKRFASLLEQIVPDLLTSFRNEAEEWSNEEVWGEAEEEIQKIIDEFDDKEKDED